MPKASLKGIVNPVPRRRSNTVAELAPEGKTAIAVVGTGRARDGGVLVEKAILVGSRSLLQKGNAEKQLRGDHLSRHLPSAETPKSKT
jgi:hypothetical protein